MNFSKVECFFCVSTDFAVILFNAINQSFWLKLKLSEHGPRGPAPALPRAAGGGRRGGLLTCENDENNDNDDDDNNTTTTTTTTTTTINTF